MDLMEVVKEEKEQEKSFAKGYNLYKFFWVYYIGSFFGVIIEMLVVFVKTGYFQSRTALILEPLNPVYGLGAVLITLIFSKINKIDWFTTIVISMVILGSFEWVMSYLQETTFGTVSWYYPDSELGVFGRTSIILSFYWGILAVIWVRIWYPFISKTIESIPNNIGRVLTVALLIFTLLDSTFSYVAMKRHVERTKGIPAITSIDRFLDKRVGTDFIKEIYPNLVYIK